MITTDSCGSEILALWKLMNSTALEFSKAAIWTSGLPPSELPVSHKKQNFLLDRADIVFLHWKSSDTFPYYCYWKTLLPEPLHKQLLISLCNKWRSILQLSKTSESLIGMLDPLAVFQCPGVCRSSCSKLCSTPVSAGCLESIIR